MKKINLLGIALTDYTLREALKLSNEYLYNGALSTISYISTQILVEAAEHEEQKSWLEAIDMTICGETDILRAAEMETRNRIREVENDEFLKEFIHKLARNKRKVYLIAGNEEEINKLEKYLKAYSPELLIVGNYTVDFETLNRDNLINDINDIVPNVIISRLPYPMQEQLMHESKMLINADIWLALLEHAHIHTQKRNTFVKITNLLYRKLFHRKVNQYRPEEKQGS